MTGTYLCNTDILPHKPYNSSPIGDRQPKNSKFPIIKILARGTFESPIVFI